LFSYFSNTQELENNPDIRSRRSARHRKNPKIFRDDYVTSITGKRRPVETPHDLDGKSNDDQPTIKKKPGRKRENKIEVSC
jgi:hypothetical protein